ncbi:MAG: hypothetical protein ACTSPY_01100 [Candidatus Helarchaeota archaeon]
MGDIKVSNKKLIDDLQAKLILHLGRKITQQETLDLCLLYAMRNFEDILALASSTPSLSPEKAKKIIKKFKKFKKFKNTPYDKKAKYPRVDDEEIYSF